MTTTTVTMAMEIAKAKADESGSPAWMWDENGFPIFELSDDAGVTSWHRNATGGQRFEFRDGSALVCDGHGWDFGIHRDHIEHAKKSLKFAIMAWASSCPALDGSRDWAMPAGPDNPIISGGRAKKNENGRNQ